MKPKPTPSEWTLLKADLFGTVERGHCSQGPCVRRDTRRARWWCRPLAIALARREARALAHLSAALPQEAGRAFPRLWSWQDGVLLRSWLDGKPLQEADTQPSAFFEEARRLVARLHRQGVVHNDLAKEPNLLVTPEGRPALVDMQLAAVHRRRTRLFRLAGREDLRHLLKHKRHYHPHTLSPRETAILARPSAPARWWRRLGKPLYHAITRGLLGWADREGAGDRGRAEPPA